MKLGENYRVEADALNLILYKKRKPKKSESKERWDILGYFSELGHLLKYLADYEVRATELKDLKTVTEKQSEIYSLIRSLDFSNVVIERKKGRRGLRQGKEGL